MQRSFLIAVCSTRIFLSISISTQIYQFYSPCNHWKINNFIGNFIAVVIFQKGLISFCCSDFFFYFSLLYFSIHTLQLSLSAAFATTKAKESSLHSKVPLVLEILAFLGIFLTWEMLWPRQGKFCRGITGLSPCLPL